MVKNTAGALLATGAASFGYFQYKERQATAAVRNKKLTIQPISCSRVKSNFSTLWIGSPYSNEGTICRITENVGYEGPVSLAVRLLKPDVTIHGDDHPATRPIRNYAKLCGRIRPVLDLAGYDPVKVLQKTQKSWEEKELKAIDLGHVAKMEGLEEAEKALPDELKEKIPYFVDALKMHVILTRKLQPEARTSQLHQAYALGPNPFRGRVKEDSAFGFLKTIDGRVSIETNWGSLEIGKHENLTVLLMKMNNHFHKRGVMLTARTFHGRHFLYCNSRGEKQGDATFRTDTASDEVVKIKNDWEAIRDIVFDKVMREMEKSKKRDSASDSIKEWTRNKIVSLIRDSS